MKPYRLSRRLLGAASVFVIGAFAASTSFAADVFPSKPIRFIVPFAAGGSGDQSARIIANELSIRMRQPVVVENKPGAGGLIGQDYVSKAPPDGYTILYASSQGILSYHLANRPFDFRKAFTGLAQVYPQYALLTINPAAPGMRDITTLSQLVAYSKSHPDTLNYTSSGTGSSGQLMVEKIKSISGASLQHIPYKGGAPALQDVLGGRVPVWAGTMYHLSMVRSGQLRALAVGSAERSPELPEVPTLIEQGFPGLVANSLQAIAGPPGLPDDIRGKLEAELQATLSSPDVIQKMALAGIDVKYADGKTVTQSMVTYYDYWGGIIKSLGMKPE